MDVKDFYYDLPPELIAQTPIKDRDMSRLLVLNKETGELSHRVFSDVIDYLHPGDCLVLNDTKVIPARIYGVSEKTSGPIEFLLLKRLSLDTWEVILKPGKRGRVGAVISFGDGILKGEILKINEVDGTRIVKFTCDGNFMEILDKIGNMPLPPYIKERLLENDRYNTVYAKDPGSAAAPTAGLHFTNALLDKIRAKGVEVLFLTLHVGLGTFRPVKEEKIESHVMHSEYCHLSSEVAGKINAAKARGNKIFAVGTTVCRTLETAALEKGKVSEFSGETDIFIYPGYEFKAIDALITNFHLPESTLIMLVSALAGREKVMHAYEEAIRERYHFFSFGDSSLIL